MIDLHNKGCACFKCAPIEDFIIVPGDVLTPIPEMFADAYGEIRIIAIELSGKSRRVIYTTKIGEKSWEHIKERCNLISWVRDPPKDGLDDWSEAAILRRFKLKEKK